MLNYKRISFVDTPPEELDVGRSDLNIFAAREKRKIFFLTAAANPFIMKKIFHI